MGNIRKRKNQTVSERDKGQQGNNHVYNVTTHKHTSKADSSWLSYATVVVGMVTMAVCASSHSWFVYTLHENHLWFTNIKELEREISFRTESGLYYSYYKQLVLAPSLWQGVHDLMNDRLTEYPDTINILERMNIYQEVIVAALYRIFPTKEEPIMFYIKAVFALHGLLVAALFATTWLLSRSWVAGLLTAAFYSLNKEDTTRVMFTVPLRESFALPFLWVQGAALTYYFRSHSAGLAQHVSVLVMGVSTFLFCLFWQFNQFVMLLQAVSLFGVWILDLLPTHKIRTVLLTQAASLLAVCLLQLVNKMILGSLVLAFIPATLIIMALRGSGQSSGHWFINAGKVLAYSLLTLGLMFLINFGIKFILQVEADEHIFKFLQNKFGVGNIRDFDSRLYLCLGIFGFLTFDVFERLTSGLVLPFYICAHFVLLGVLLVACLQKWRQVHGDGVKPEEIGRDNGKGAGGNGPHNSALDSKKKFRHVKKETDNFSGTHILEERPELAFHTVQCVLFGVLAMSTLRMKYLWTPYMCILAALAIGDSTVWSTLLSIVKKNTPFTVEICRHSAMFVILAVLVSSKQQSINYELYEDLREFWDPDTVELMEWIIRETPPMASFTGSMQLLAGVKLCTGRPINNHPHYEDKALRRKTKQLYQIYGRRTPQDVHAILTLMGNNYIILEDSICRAPTGTNCRTPDLIDLDNGVVPDEAEPEPGLTYSSVPRFCMEVRNQSPEYARYFKQVLVNKTFQVYKLL